MAGEEQVVLLLTDVVGSSPRWDQEPLAMSDAMARHDALIAEIVGRHRGEVLKRRGEGDSSFNVLPTPTAAAAAAAEIQLAITHLDWPTREPIRLRIAVDAGPALARDGDWHGATVVRCARLRSLAGAAQTLCSGEFAAQVALPPECEMRAVGTVELRGLRDPVVVHEIRHRELDVPLVTLAAPPASDAGSTLPPRRRLYGRERDLAALHKLLVRDRLRHVALVGPGGIGKTSLAVGAAHEVLQALDTPVHWVDLRPAASIDDARRRVLDAVPTATSENGAISVDRPALVVLDNLEHLSGGDDLVAALLNNHDVAILTTSRRRPMSNEAAVVTVAPLRGGRDGPATALLLDRIRLARPDRDLDADALDAVGSLADRVQGVPLALELIASRAAATPLIELQRRIDDGGLADLRRPRSNEADAHSSVQAVLDWSWGLLSDSAALLLARLSVCPDGAGRELVEALTPEASAWDLDDDLHELVVNSLVELQEQGDASRYRLLEVVRTAAARRLEHAQDVEATHTAVAGWVIAALSRAAADVSRVRAWVRAEDALIRAALRWAAADSFDPQLAQRLLNVLPRDSSFGFDEVVTVTERLLLLTSDAAERRALHDRAAEAIHLHDPSAAATHYGVVETLSVAMGDRETAALAAYHQAQALGLAGDPGEEDAYRRALEQTDRDSTKLAVLTNLGQVALAQGLIADSFDAYAEALKIAYANEAYFWAMILHANRATSYMLAGDIDTAFADNDAALALPPDKEQFVLAARLQRVKLLMARHDLPAASTSLAEAVAFVEDRSLPADDVLAMTASLALSLDQVDAARHAADRLRELRIPGAAADCNAIAGVVELAAGHPGRAVELLTRAVRVMTDNTWSWELRLRTLTALAAAAARLGRGDDARAAAMAALVPGRRIPLARVEQLALAATASGLVHQDPERAVLALGAYNAVTTQRRLDYDEVPFRDLVLEVATGKLGEARVEELTAHGHALASDERTSLLALDPADR